MKLQRSSLPILIFSLLFCCLTTACSPWYVIRAGWKEIGILSSREEISKIVADENTPEEVKGKLKRVIQARDFASGLGLSPKDSFTQYSEIDSDVLVWVISAAPKTSFDSKTWWFPIVGRVPYKGFFSREEAEQEARELSLQGYDTYLRPSSAFSTLGWFNDPLLSTTLAHPEEIVVDTVIHEIVHSTLWVPNSVSFNETAANMIAGVATIKFYEQFGDSEKVESSRKRLNTQLSYAKHLEQLQKELEKLYAECNPSCEKSPEILREVLKEKKRILQAAAESWRQSQETKENNRGVRPRRRANTGNNAVIVAQKFYLDRPHLFIEFLQENDNSIEKLVDEMKFIEKNVKLRNEDPYKLLEERLSHAQ